MSWREDIRQPSFRGVPFEATELSGESGRRIVAEDTPETEEIPPTADMGPIRPSFRMRAFVVGDDYLDRRDALLAALNTKGPGLLVHPWRGEVLVATGRVNHFNDVEHGRCVVEFDCVLHGGVARPYLEKVASASVPLRSTSAVAAAGAYYGPLAIPSGRAWQAEWASLTAFLGGVDDLFGEDLFESDEWSLTTMDEMAQALQLATSARDLFRYLQGQLVNTFESMFGTPAEDELDAAADAMNGGIRTLVMVRMVELAAADTYASADAAEAAMGAYANTISAWLVGILDRDLYIALAGLRNALVDVLMGIASRLPRERTIVVPVPTPAILVAFNTYGPRRLLAREAEIIASNDLGHPGFVHGSLKVLSR